MDNYAQSDCNKIISGEIFYYMKKTDTYRNWDLYHSDDDMYQCYSCVPRLMLSFLREQSNE